MINLNFFPFVTLMTVSPCIFYYVKQQSTTSIGVFAPHGDGASYVVKQLNGKNSSPLACFCRLFPSGIVYISLTASNPVRIHHKPALIGRRKNISFKVEISLHIFFDRIYLLFFNHICKILPGALQRITRFRGI